MDRGIRSSNCLDIWTEENNDIIKKWKVYCLLRNERGQETQHDARKRYYSEIHKLLQKIQGVPCVPASVRLELTIRYNTLLFALSLSEFTETRVLLTQGLVRALEANGCQPPGSELILLWQTALQSFAGTDLLSCLHQLLCVQWALWLCTDQLEELQILLSGPQKEIAAAPGDLLAVIGDLRFSIEGNPSLLVAMAPGELKELVHICTVTTKGIGEMEEGKDSEALLTFQEALSQPAPRTLLAQLHTLAGICLAKLAQPQSAMQCFRKALEVDFGCRSALYQSSLLYGRLGNVQAEMEALHLLHAAVTLSGCGDSARDQAPLLSAESLLRSPTLACFLATPSPPGIQHALAHRCLQSHRIPEAVEHFLDLLTSLQADGKLLVNTSGSPSLPRVPEIYLEAAFTMLKAKRYWDCVAICEEVISKTVDLVPERLALELPIEGHQEPESMMQPAPLTGRKTENVEERLNFVLWAGAAYLLQGLTYGHIKDNAEALTNFTRSINVLLKVLVKNKDGQFMDPGDGQAAGIKLQTLQRLKGLALAGRGVCFMHARKQKEALQDFQLSLQASPGSEHADLWLVEALWQLERKEEALSHWRSRSRSSAQRPAPLENTPGGLPLYLHYNLQDGISFEPEGLKKKMEDLIHSRGVPTCEDI
ncbi:Fanconi anemia group G protein isoform X1 [Anguilla anguilla]|uniref:Fanconi anemia group G protein isoform X1 n=1 Tax=Anguilla anguilla TaxID=7936 RepID=UPI0015AC10F1|nr:Fanconi anemia group G protein isoform X1 [Anguilla anguilla]